MCSLVCTWLRRTEICSAFGAGERDGGALRLDLPAQRVQLALRRRLAGAGGVELLRRYYVLLGQVLRPRVGDARLLQVGRRGIHLRFNRRERRLGLTDLGRPSAAPAAAAPPPTRESATTWPSTFWAKVGGVGLELVGDDHGDELDPSSPRRLR